MNTVDAAATAFSRLSHLAEAMEVGNDVHAHCNHVHHALKPSMASGTTPPPIQHNATTNHIGRQHCFKLQTPEDLCGLFQPRQRPKVPRKRIDPRDTAHLQGLFDRGLHFPSREQRETLAEQLGLTPRTIQVWFQNRRQFSRNKSCTASIGALNVGSERRHSISGSQPHHHMSSNNHQHSPPPLLQIRWMQPIIVDKQGRPMSMLTTMATTTTTSNQQAAVSRRNEHLDERMLPLPTNRDTMIDKNPSIVLPLPPILCSRDDSAAASTASMQFKRLPSINHLMEKPRRSSVS